MEVSKTYRFIFVFFAIILFSCQKEDPNALFTELPARKTGVSFRNLVKESEEFNVLTYGYFYQGGGVAVGDINNDGLPDLYFTGNMMASKLYLNRGNFEFEDITEQAGVEAAGLWNTGVTMVDVNGDGLVDIYICRSAANDPNNRRNLLYINNGDLTFTERAKEFGLDDPGFSTQATFFDYDRDGDLDMFLLNHSTQDFAGFSRIDGSFKNRKGQYLGDKLYRNDGGKFTEVTEESGIISNVLGFGLAVTVSDVNNDGWPDIYVSNDYNEEDYLYINQQDGTFRESVRQYMGHVSLFSMGADGADLNNNLWPDIITMDMMPEYNFNQKSILGPENYDKYRELLDKGFHSQSMRNMLHLNQGNGYFSEVGQYAGISQTDWSWAVLAADFDNDGWKDLLITNGYARNYLDMDFLNYLVSERIKSTQSRKEEALMELIEKMPPIYVENYLYHNNGDMTFTNRAAEWGLKGLTVSNAAAYADLDGDGDLDLIICHTNDAVSLYRNNSERLSNNNFLKIRLKGDTENTLGIGTKVLLYGEGKHLHQELMPVRGYQSSVSHELIFGLGEMTNVDSLEVYWPDGRKQVITRPGINEVLLLDQSQAFPFVPKANHVSPKFKEINHKLGIHYSHSESDYLDFTQDRLMPNTMSTLGPKLAKGDINGDGLEDIFIGGGKNSPGKFFLQLPNGTFKEHDQPSLDMDSAYIDTNAILADFNGDGSLDLYLVSGGSDYPDGNPMYQDRLYFNDGKGNFIKNPDALPEMHVSGSTVTVGDFDGDGHPDLFVGGRFSPGNYPLSPRSYLLRNDGTGRFTDVTEKFCPELMAPGMVSDALFVPLNDDGHVDLIVVGEWMDIGIYLNQGGKYMVRHTDAIQTDTHGWWLKIHAEDMDNDGDMDIFIGNYGLNNPYKPNEERPMRMIYKDFDNNGQIDPIFSYYIADTNAFAFSRDELIGQIAHMKGRFPDYKSFAKAGLKDLFSKEELEGADSLQVTLLQSVYLENDGNGNFKLGTLPKEAQYSPIFAFAVADVDGDGHMDLLTGGNLQRTRVSSGRQDANYGYVFFGDGKGNFNHRPSEPSGLVIKGDVRDMTIMEIQRKNYLLVGRNNQALKIYGID